RIASLEVRVPRLTITRGKGAETAVIELDGVALGSTQLGSAIPLDPGPHVGIGRAGDKIYARQTRELPEKHATTVEVTGNHVPIEKVYVPRTGEGTGDKPPQEQPRSRVPGIIVTSAGAVSVGIGVVFIVLRGNTISDLDKICHGTTTCPKSAESIGSNG